ncbi:MAG: hypothetical protein ACK56F_07365, partial [bacterium]
MPLVDRDLLSLLQGCKRVELYLLQQREEDCRRQQDDQCLPLAHEICFCLSVAVSVCLFGGLRRGSSGDVTV